MRKHSLQSITNTRGLWAALLLLFFILVVAWFADPLGYAKKAQPSETPPSRDWVAQPEGPAVPVRLPEVPIKKTEAVSHRR